MASGIGGSNRSRQRRLWVPNSSFTRRQLLAGAGGAAAAVALASCSGAGTSPSGSKSPSGTPKRGGNFRLGMLGGSKDVFDAHVTWQEIDAARVSTTFEPLLSFDDNFELATDSLAESMEIDSPTQYTFRLRRGVEFHNGKTLTADDVMYSLRRLASNVELAGNPSTASMDITGMKKLDEYTFRLPLKRPDATVPLSLATWYSNSIVPEGYQAFSGDVSSQAGTGPFKLKSFTAGQESVHERNPNYWREGQPYFDTVTITDFSDETGVLNALRGRQIDAMNSLPTAQVSAVTDSGAQVLETPVGNTILLCMLIDKAPFDDVRVRQAFRLIADRQTMLDQVWSRRGSLGNDTYNSDFTTDLPQRAQDIAKAKELLKAAGYENLTIDLPTTNYSSGYVETCTTFAQHAKEAGVTVNVKNMPDGPYWSDAYTQAPIFTSSYVLKPYLIQASQRSIPGAVFPETNWPPKSGPGSEYLDLYNAALSETDEAQRVEIQRQMVELEYEYGGNIIPVSSNKLDGYASNVQGLSSEALTAFGLNDFGHGFRTIWFG